MCALKNAIFKSMTSSDNVFSAGAVSSTNILQMYALKQSNFQKYEVSRRCFSAGDGSAKRSGLPSHEKLP